MKEYDVKITETLEKTVTVQAESHDAAEEQVRAAYYNSEYIGNNGRNADGNGFGSFARLVPAILYRAGHDVRFGNHHLCDRLRSND